MNRYMRACFLAMAMLCAGPARAADLDVPARPKPAPPPNASIFAPPDATCVEWTDGCRVCQKAASGEATCSNPGIACIPKAARCTKH